MMFGALTLLIFIRPFVSSLAFTYSNFIISTILLLFLLLWFIRFGLPKKTIKDFAPAFMLFLLGLSISVACSRNKTISLLEIYKYISGISIFLIMASLDRKKQIRIVHTLVFAGVIISILAIYQYFFGFRHILDYMRRQGISSSFAIDYIERKRVFFPFVTPNALAGYLSLILFLCFLEAEAIFIAPLILFTLLLSKSVGAFLSLTVCLLFLLSFDRKAWTKKILPIFWVVPLILIIILLMRFGSPGYHRHPLFSAVMRLDYWLESTKIILRHPLAGIGPGNFNLVFSRYAHNSYLQLWAEAGVFTFLGFFWIIFKALQIGLKKIKEGRGKESFEGLMLLCSALVFIIHNLIDFSLFLPEISLLWWAILGMLLTPQETSTK